MTTIKSLLGALSLVSLLIFSPACSSDSGGDSGDTGDSGGDTGDSGGDSGDTGDSGANLAPYNQLSDDSNWSLTQIDAGSGFPAGIQGILERADDGTLYYAYFRFASPTDGCPQNCTCNIAVFAGGAAPGVNYELVVNRKGPNDTDWTSGVVPLDQVGAADHRFVTALFGLDSAIDCNGNLVLTMAAGGAGLASCGSTDLVIATLTGTDLVNGWTFSSPVTDSSSCCAFVADDPALCEDVACTSGTDVGSWSAVAISPACETSVAYVDYHNFWDEDGQSFQGYEMYDTAEGIYGIRPWSGLGVYGALEYVGTTLVSAFTGFSERGLFVLRREQGSATNEWVEADIRPGAEIGERIRMAKNADESRLGIAFYENIDRFGTQVRDLVFCESEDAAETWNCVPVDSLTLQVGEFPDLIYDNEGRPVLAYHNCGGGTSCDTGNDSVRIAWRELDGTTWNTVDVYRNSQATVGLYNQIVIDPDTNVPTVVFQELGAGYGRAWSAQGVYP